MDTSKKVQRKATKIIHVLENKTFEERSKDWGFFWMRNSFKMICGYFQCLIQRTIDKHFYLSPTKDRQGWEKAESETKDLDLKGEKLVEEGCQPLERVI